MFYGPKPTKSYVARTRHFWRRVGVGHRNGYDSPDSGVRRVSSFFFFFVSPTRADAAPTRLRHSSDAAPTLPTRQQWRKKRKFRHISDHSGHSGKFRLKWKFRPIQDFDWKKKKKSKSRSYLLLLGFMLFFLLIFFLISVSSSSSSFGFGLLPDYLFFFICVSLLSSTCVQSLDFRVFRL